MAFNDKDPFYAAAGELVTDLKVANGTIPVFEQGYGTYQLTPDGHHFVGSESDLHEALDEVMGEAIQSAYAEGYAAAGALDETDDYFGGEYADDE